MKQRPIETGAGLNIKKQIYHCGACMQKFCSVDELIKHLKECNFAELGTKMMELNRNSE